MLEVIRARLERQRQQARPQFLPTFDSAAPLLALDLTPRVAEMLLWVAQGKTNPEIATILGISDQMVKKHLMENLAALGIETRTAATLKALEVLSSPSAQKAG